MERIDEKARQLAALILRTRLSLHSEKETQAGIEVLLREHGYAAKREYALSKKDRPDFFVDGIAIEVKLSGSKRNIYKQCVGYCEYDAVKSMLLVTNKAMGFPQAINGKPAYLLNLGTAWL